MYVSIHYVLIDSRARTHRGGCATARGTASPCGPVRSALLMIWVHVSISQPTSQSVIPRITYHPPTDHTTLTDSLVLAAMCSAMTDHERVPNSSTRPRMASSSSFDHTRLEWRGCMGG